MQKNYKRITKQTKKLQKNYKHIAKKRRMYYNSNIWCMNR